MAAVIAILYRRVKPYFDSTGRKRHVNTYGRRFTVLNTTPALIISKLCCHSPRLPEDGRMGKAAAQPAFLI
jgi:hypothetical protein